jgi:hypothetical protein
LPLKQCWRLLATGTIAMPYLLATERARSREGTDTVENEMYYGDFSYRGTDEELSSLTSMEKIETRHRKTPQHGRAERAMASAAFHPTAPINNPVLL